MRKKLVKRNLFVELAEGFDALAGEREGTPTLRPRAISPKPVVFLSADELVSIRETLHISRAVFAGYLRISVRTLEKWEKGRGKPNAQAAILVRMMQRFPDTVNRLAEI